MWPDAFFTVVILFSVAVFVMSLRGHFFGLRFFCYINLLSAAAFLTTMLFIHLLEDITQIKYGFYLFLINTIATIVFSKRISPYGDN